MLVRRRFTLVLHCFLYGAAAAVPSAAAWDPAAPLARRIAGEADIQWIAPAAGVQLVPGSLVDLEWRADPTVLARHGIEEWEVFLSLDGGWSYRVRITPHLDIGSTRFLWRVPHELATSWAGEARLLLRFGDEREEHTFDPAVSLTFAAADEARSVAAAVVESLFTFEAEVPGESARDGDAGVLWWEEGARDGSRARRRMARPATRPAWSASLRAEFALACVGPPSSSTAEICELTPRRRGYAAKAAPPPSPIPRAPAVPVRLTTHRFNE